MGVNDVLVAGCIVGLNVDSPCLLAAFNQAVAAK
jgi:hypothetical protein